ncbi:MAG: hypothetical protein ACRCXD_13595 [Luteolibacter sp.]
MKSFPFLFAHAFAAQVAPMITPSTTNYGGVIVGNNIVTDAPGGALYTNQ